MTQTESLSALKLSFKNVFFRFKPPKIPNQDVNLRVDPLSISPSSSSFLFLSLWLIYRRSCSDWEHRSTSRPGSKNTEVKRLKAAIVYFK